MKTSLSPTNLPLTSSERSLSRLSSVVSRAITAENPTGEKGRGGLATEGAQAYAARDLGPGWKISPCAAVKPGETLVLADVKGPGCFRHMWITDSCDRNRKLVIRFYWEDETKPSVEAPLGDFFACADQLGGATVSSATVCVNPRRARHCFWEMPFRRWARVTLENLHDKDVVVYWQIDLELGEQPPDAAYFHAQFRRSNRVPERGVHTILDGVRGRGHYVGTYGYWSILEDGWWGEGEVKFYLDGDRKAPTICGTGTEDYFGGAWNFDNNGAYQTFCTPYMGLSHVARPDGLYRAVPRFSMYRWHIPDPVRFSKDIRVTVQDLGWRDGGRFLARRDDISTVAYWYQDTPFTDFPPFPSVDALEIT